MALTLLFDLDDTLLNTNMGEFIPAYFQALSQHLSRWVKPDAMLPALMAGTQRMLENEDPTLTLQHVFEKSFYPQLGIDKGQVQAALEEFYDNEFRSLSGITSKRPGAGELVDWAIAEGHRVVVATDPIFPLKGIEERIRWAGLDPKRFDLVTSFESFHFTKSHPAFYAEVLGRMGWPDGPVLMIGNDEQRDLACAQELGLLTYQVDGAAPVAMGAPVARRASRPIGRGSLTDLQQWLENTDPVTLEPSYHHSQEAILAILASTPAILYGLASGLSVEAWKHEPTPEDWAMIELVCHLRDTEREVHHAQLDILEDEAQPFVPRPDAAVWAKQRQYLHEDGENALAQFASARLETLRRLRGVDPQLWRRAARHAIFGPTNFQEVVGFMGDHDRLHIQQAWQTLRAPA